VTYQNGAPKRVIPIGTDSKTGWPTPHVLRRSSLGLPGIDPFHIRDLPKLKGGFAMRHIFLDDARITSVYPAILGQNVPEKNC